MHLWNGNGFKNLSLRAKLVLGGFLILLVPLLIIGTITFTNSYRALEEMSKLQNIQIAQSLSDMVQLALEKDLRILSAVATDPLVIEEVISGNFEVTTGKLADLYRIIGADFEGLAVFNQKGVICADGVDPKRVGISISDRYYFTTAKKGQHGIGHMTASKASGLPIFGLSVPILSNKGKFLGGVLGIVKADYLLRYISSIKLGITGYAFMVNNQGLIIAHPREDYILKLNSLEDTQLQAYAQHMISQERGTGKYFYDGRWKVAGFTTVPFTSWKITISQNQDEIMGLAYSNLNFILLVSSFFLGITALAIFFLSRTISAPFQKTLTTLSQAVSQASEAFIIIGPDRKVQFVNPAMAAIIDRPISDLIGNPLSSEGIESMDPDEIWNAILKNRKWTGRITGGRLDSSFFTLELTITPVWDGGIINCYLGIGRDITQELSMQARIRQSEKMEAIGTLAGGIAHDFNNILSAIFGFTELAMDYQEDPKRITLYLAEILKAAKRAGDLVNHILTFSRRSDIGQKPVISKYVVKEALQLLRASLPSTIEIQEQLTSSAAILGDPTQVHQVVVNLCTNAGYVMREEGGILSVSLDETEDCPFLQNTGMAPGPYLRLEVRDSGTGIAPELQSRIFDPFFTTKPPGEGTGLGLSVVHGIVKSLNGSISVSSEPGQGTLFTVYLPVIRTDEVDADGEREEALPGGSERVMLVDDEEALITSGKERLNGLGYRVEGFTGAMQALSAFLKNPSGFDVLVTDYTMPFMTGYDLAIKIREERGDLPIIICSGYLSLEEKLKELPGIEFVKKPVTTQEIAHALRRVLDGGESVQ